MSSMQTIPSTLASATLAALARTNLGILVSSTEPGMRTERTVYANAAASHMIGLPLEALLGRVVEPGCLGDAHFLADEPLSRSPVGTVHEQQGELLRRDGQRLAVRWISIRTTSDDLPHNVHFLLRADRRSRAEQALLDSEQRFRRLIDTAPDGMLVLVGARIAYANQAVTRLHAYSHPRQLAHLTLGHLFVPSDEALLRERIQWLVDHTQATRPFEIRAVRRDGRTVPVEVGLVPTEWDAERAVLILVRDLSGRRETQNQWVRTDRLAAVGTLAAGVAHEINNPLAYVLLNIQYLLREVRKVPPNLERLGHLLERIHEARHGAERVATIVRDLRTFSQTAEEELGPVDVRRVLASAIKVARSQLMDRGQIHEHFEDVPPAVGHAARLEQVFLNLLVNAIQALPETGVNANHIHIRISSETGQPQDWVVVSVADTGAGIPSQHLDRVFDPFFTTKPIGLGTGLGLPICHSIITRMGGTIRVESQVGKGTVFVVRLPAAPAVMQLPTRTLTPVSVCVNRRARILVVDDELPVATILSRVLEDEHDVEIATDAEVALDMLASKPFDIVMCDLLMPRMSGMDLHAEIAQRHPGLEERLVFMTGGAFTPRAAQFLARVPNPRIEKPFDLRAVRKLVREWKLQGREIG